MADEQAAPDIAALEAAVKDAQASLDAANRQIAYQEYPKHCTVYEKAHDGQDTVKAHAVVNSKDEEDAFWASAKS